MERKKGKKSLALNTFLGYNMTNKARRGKTNLRPSQAPVRQGQTSNQ